ncbi:DMT family transporter [Sciscionella sediminilitoris]|uniref:DMT family transporter n=1 Tax=Sciscionella sediminilitoris TaxID=1445613 RepID=UPI0005670180|nr:DMT family transporter [Sciscionella sp. SE31]
MVNTELVVAAPLAVLAAACIGLASAAQAGAAKQVEATGTLDPRLFKRLVQKPLWLLGVGCTIAGLVLQLLALNFGPLILVQPIIITSLLFATVFYAWFGHTRIDGIIMVGALLCCGGLAAFMLLARPTPGTSAPKDVWGPVPLAIVLVLVLGAGVLTANHVGRRFKVLLLALCTGLAYGMTAALMKVITSQLQDGIGAIFAHPVLYLACALGPVGFLLAQNTFQVGKLLSPALAVITVVDPIIGVLLGMQWFDEKVTVTPGTLIGEIIAGAAVIGGISLLSRRADHITASHAPQGDEAEGAGEVPGDTAPQSSH